MKKQTLKKIAFVLILIFPPWGFAAEESTAPRIEGIMVDSKMPSESIVIIDGELYKAGDQYLDYEIKQIQSQSVEVLNHATGETLRLQAQEKSVEDPGPPPLGKPNSTPNPAQSFINGMVEKVLYGGTPLAEINALSEIKTIQTSVMRYVVNEGYSVRVLDLPTLVKRGVLSREYEDSMKGSYKFNLQVIDHGVQISADPIENETKLRHFLLADDGTLYYERGKPATKQSAFQER